VFHRYISDLTINKQIKDNVAIFMQNDELLSNTSEENCAMETPLATPFIFISYARADSAFVNRLMKDLKARNVNFWIDQEGITPGTPDWEDAIRTALHYAYAVLYIASPEARRSLNVKDELHIAKKEQCPIYPVWARGDQWMDAVPIGLGSTQYIDARAANYENALQSIIKARHCRNNSGSCSNRHGSNMVGTGSSSIASGQTKQAS
jgi:TIR domain